MSTFKQIKEELCAEGLPANSYCPIQTPIVQNIFSVNADNFSCGDIFSYSDISDNESKHIFSNEEIQNLLTDYYKGEAQFKGNCQMGTENFIQSEVSLPDGAKFKPEINTQVMDTISDANYSKFGQLQANDIYFPLNSAFWNKDEFSDKMLHSSQTENCPFTFGPTIYIENVNENCIDDICESSRSHIVFKCITIWYHLLQIHIGL